jgi:hypothetical protein
MAETITPTNRVTTSSGERTTGEVRTDLEDQRRQANQRMRPEVETHRTQAQQQAERTLDSEAITAIQQTERAVNAVAENRVDEALAAIEQATGKLDILLSRNPSTALIPVNLHVAVIDTAPHKIEDIRVLKDVADTALEFDELPRARATLDRLRSEIRVRIYNLPLATYPAALKEAARLLDQKKTREAGNVLLTALNTLVAIDQVTPLPLLLTRGVLDEAQAQAQKDKDAAERLLEIADHELERTIELGYTAKDSDYETLRDEVRDLRKQLKGNKDTTSLFSGMKEKLASLIRRGSEKQVRSDGEHKPQKAA